MYSKSYPPRIIFFRLEMYSASEALSLLNIQNSVNIALRYYIN